MGNKRGRGKETDESESASRWVYFVAFDAPFQPVLVDTHLLRDVACRSWLMIQHEPPHLEMEGLPTWRITSMSRAMLVAFLKCLFHREFVVPKDVSYYEAVRALESEGIGVPGGKVEPPDARMALKKPPLGIGMCTNKSNMAETVQHICTLIANSIDQWPRLQLGMTGTLTADQSTFSCSTSRCWIRFAEKPNIELSGTSLKKPYWLMATLASIAYNSSNIVMDHWFDPEYFNKHTFSVLARDSVDNDPTYCFLSVKRDMQRTAREQNREAIRNADRFAHAVIRAADETSVPSDAVPTTSVSPAAQYARACISLAERTVRRTPNLSRMFNGDCADDKGQTHERQALEKVLKARGIKVLMWKDAKDRFLKENDVKPLVFPPSYLSHINTSGTCILLDFQQHQTIR